MRLSEIGDNMSNGSTGKSEEKVYDKAETYFNCTPDQRAAFEAGIKLGAIYHQFVGTPVSQSNAEILERAIEDGVRIQPFVHNVSVKINRDKLKNKHDEYDYDSLTGNMLDVRLEIRYKDTTAVSQLRYINDLNYPLMYISSLK
jgi:hypothetical protein